ncbi:DUF3967 domain-containing protein [Bacillus sp. BP-3]|uniref:DUF3967 domain-containing protein n=1 Tax=Bacillus sp. BP-3 TaxID=3022773 RepID=UPI00232E752B|nr:DUF3967 domain-containing protein [Bacillus sp. BP-3]MDC2867329.1 DUF3967 domain-containing protein [Bacillus sp. BP-3]
MTTREDHDYEGWRGNQEGSYKKTYSLADIARHIGKPRTTLQAWRDQFKPYLPTVPGTKGRTLRYSKESLELFKLIANMKDAQEPPDVIENMLKKTVNYIVVEEESDLDNEMTKPVLQRMYESMGEVAIYLQNQESLNIQLLHHIKELEESNKVLLNKIEDQQKMIDKIVNNKDQQLLELIREVQATKEIVASTKQEGSWFSRLFKK